MKERDLLNVLAICLIFKQLPIYQFDYKGIQLGFFNTILGGAGSSALLEEIIALGAEKNGISVF